MTDKPRRQRKQPPLQEVKSPCYEGDVELRPSFLGRLSILPHVQRVWSTLFAFDGNCLRRLRCNRSGELLVADRPKVGKTLEYVNIDINEQSIVNFVFPDGVTDFRVISPAFFRCSFYNTPDKLQEVCISKHYANDPVAGESWFVLDHDSPTRSIVLSFSVGDSAFTGTTLIQYWS